jgi:uncharacterized membrane protein (UPF0136 family)
LSASKILPLGLAMVLIGLLAVFFGIRFAKWKKFMPAGLMALLSFAALIALFAIR